MATNIHKMLEMMIYNFIRTHYESKSKFHVPIALKHLLINFSKQVFPSTILSFKEDTDFFQLLVNKLMDKIAHKRIKLLYRASENDFTSQSYHDKCDNHMHGPLITIIKSNYGNIFGGYTSCINITNSEGSSRDAFIFLIRSDNELQITPIIFDSKKQFGLCQNSTLRNRGPVFECNHDHLSDTSMKTISVGDKCNYSSVRLFSEVLTVGQANRMCYTSGALINTWKELIAPLSGGSYTDSDSYCFFQVTDYEVFQLQ